MPNYETIFINGNNSYQVYQPEGSSKWYARRKGKSSTNTTSMGKFDTREQAIRSLELHRGKSSSVRFT